MNRFLLITFVILSSQQAQSESAENPTAPTSTQTDVAMQVPEKKEKIFYHKGYLTLKNEHSKDLLISVFSAASYPIGKDDFNISPYLYEQVLKSQATIQIPEFPLGIFLTQKNESSNQTIRQPIWGLKTIILVKPLENYDNETKEAKIIIKPSGIQIEKIGTVIFKEENGSIIIENQLPE